MGRITVFSLDSCPHCVRTKLALKQRGIPYTEISLSTHPNRRTDMISLSDRMSVPQVFFNDKHMGGADETIALLEGEGWDKNVVDQSPLKTYSEQVAAQPDPTDARLRKPLDSERVIPKEPLPRDENDNVELPDGTTLTVLELVEQLKTILAGQDKVTVCKVYKNAFTGQEGVAALVKEFGLKDKDAVVFGNELIDRSIVQTLGGDYGWSHSEVDIFRLQCYDTPNILNSYRVWDTRVDPDSVGVLNECKKLLGKVEAAVTNKDGLVNYKKASQSEHWPVFEEAVCELQRIPLASFDLPTRRAFGINLYNLMIKYAFMKVGIHDGMLGLMTYFTDILFNVGGLLYGFHDLESGILRGNRPAPYTLSPTIGKKDPRLAAVFPAKDVDPRIHFGLNCGAKSCPPVKNFTPEGIEEELRIVAMAFAEDDDNVKVDTKKRVLTLSQIINWYRIDFAPSNKELPLTIVQYLRGEKKQQLQAMIDDGKNIQIKFQTYDWSTNASDHVVYRKANIKGDYLSYKSLICTRACLKGAIRCLSKFSRRGGKRVQSQSQHNKTK